MAYPVHLVLLYFTKDFRRFLVDHGHAKVGLFPYLVSKSVVETRDDDTAEDCDGKYKGTIIPLTDDLYQTAKGHGKDIKIELLYTAMERILEPSSTVFG